MRPVSDQGGAEGAEVLADVKAALARAGAQLSPDAKLTAIEKPRDAAAVVVLDRVRAGFTPDYCLHGYASCVRCDSMCYLGSETSKVVTQRTAYPLCIDCAASVVSPETRRLGEVARDHRREDGPHE